jgi:arylsulfatase A-like enzyme
LINIVFTVLKKTVMKMRIFTRRGTFLTFAVASLLPQACSNRPEIPNIILINADDLGWMDLAVYGSEYYETPNIDRILDDGRDPLFRTRPGSVVRAGRWKLHEYFEDQGFELYDLENDPESAKQASEGK